MDEETMITNQSMDDYVLFYNNVTDMTDKLIKELRERFPNDRIKIFYLLWK